MSSVPYQLTDNDVLYYLHIHKTAGTSFADILRANFKPDETSFSVFIQDFLKLPPERIANLKAFSGHYFYNIQFLIPHPLVYITMLRDPIERTISMYAQIQRMPTHYAYEIVKSQSLLEFATDPRTQPLYVNSQMRYIAADPNTTEIAKNLTAEQLKTMELWQQMERFAPNGYSDPALLERAQERLRKFAFVGLAEQYDESVEVLCYTFGWSIPAALTIFNVSGNRPERAAIPQEVIDVIRENTQLDAALYETAKQLFNARYNQMLKDHPEKIKQNPTSENDTIAAMQREIDRQKRLIDSLLEERSLLEQELTNFILNHKDTIRNYENTIHNYENTIHNYENSFGWRLILRFHAVRKKLIPEGSRRESFYQKLRDRLV